MSFGICGAHRVGKTTLCEALSNETDLPFIETSVGEVFKKMGIRADQKLNFSQRMDVQFRILDHIQKIYEAERGFFICDRTPIDLLAYTMADLSAGCEVTGFDSIRFSTYIEACFALVNDHFSTLLAIQPGIDVVKDVDGKPTGTMNMPYIEHINSLVLGLLRHDLCEPVSFLLPRKTVDLQVRVRACMRTISQTEDKVGYKPGLVALH